MDRKCFNDFLRGRKIILFGASAMCKKIVMLELGGYKIEYICDNDPNKWGTKFMGLDVYPPIKLYEEDKDSILVVITSSYKIEIERQLLAMEVDFTLLDLFYRENIRTVFKNNYSKESIQLLRENMNKIEEVIGFLGDEESKHVYREVVQKRLSCTSDYRDLNDKKEEYFSKTIFGCASDDEVYIDAGVYNSETIIDFIEYANNSYKRIYAFEPCIPLYTKVRLELNHLSDKLKIYPYGLHSEKGQLSFSSSEHESPRILDGGSDFVEVVKLDDIVNEKVTFIKMDIEGSEYEALIGAREIITTHKPKLAISLYHDITHLWEVPLLIHSMCKDYKILIQHHSDTMYDTLLYAVPKKI